MLGSNVTAPASPHLLGALAALLRTRESNVSARLYGMGYRATCSRCGGSGNYSFNPIDGTRCLGCEGRGEVAAKPSPELIERVRADVKTGALDRYLAQIALNKQIEREGRTAGAKLLDIYANSFVYRYFVAEDEKLGRAHHNHSALRFAYVDRVFIKAFDAEALAQSRFLSPEDRLEILRWLVQFVRVVEAHTAQVDACLRADIERGLIEKRRAEYAAREAQQVGKIRDAREDDRYRAATRAEAEVDLRHVPMPPKLDLSVFEAKVKAVRRTAR